AVPATSNYRYKTAKTEKINYGPEAFVPTSNAWAGKIDEGFSGVTPNGNQSLYASGGSAGNPAYFVAEVNLPDSAVITGFTAKIIKNGGSVPVTVELLRSDPNCYNNCTPTVIAVGTQAGSGGIVVTLTPAPNASFNVVDNNLYHYFIRFTGEQNTQNSRLNM